MNPPRHKIARPAELAQDIRTTDIPVIANTIGHILTRRGDDGRVMPPEVLLEAMIAEHLVPDGVSLGAAIHHLLVKTERALVDLANALDELAAVDDIGRDRRPFDEQRRLLIEAEAEARKIHTSSDRVRALAELAAQWATVGPLL